MKKLVVALLLVVMILTFSGFRTGPETKYNSALGTGGESVPLGGTYQIAGYVKVVSGTATISGWRGTDRVIPASTSADSIVTVTEGDIIPVFGKVDHLFWKGIGVAADAVVYIYKE